MSGPGKSRYKQLTGGCYHALPLLEKAGLEAVSGAEAVGLVAGHELLHGLKYHTELGVDQKVVCQGKRHGTQIKWMGQKQGNQRLTRR